MIPVLGAYIQAKKKPTDLPCNSSANAFTSASLHCYASNRNEREDAGTHHQDAEEAPPQLLWAEPLSPPLPQAYN